MTEEQQWVTFCIISRPDESSRLIKRAEILRLAWKGYTDGEIAQVLHVNESTVHRTRKKFVEHGFAVALREKPRAGRRRKLDENGKAFLIATADSDPPNGHQGWTMQLLAEQLVETQQVDSISARTVHRCLERRQPSKRRKVNVNDILIDDANKGSNTPIHPKSRRTMNSFSESEESYQALLKRSNSRC